MSLVSVVLLSATLSFGQSRGYGMGAGDVSFNAGFGNLNGIDNNRHTSFGGSGGVNSGRAAIAGEYSYLPMGSITGSGVVGKENLQQFGVALRLSLLGRARANPYFLVAGGFDRLTATASSSGLSARASQSGGYVGLGGGANLLLALHWGIRPEFRWERQQFAATRVGGIDVAGGGLNDVRGTVGLFYTWGGNSCRKR
jgi:hypothetical protein